jgi:hypothetical protein
MALVQPGVEVGVYLHNERDGQMPLPTSGDGGPTLAVGTKVCVRNRFLGDWTSGFEVAEVQRFGCRIRRLSDGHEFPDVFSFDDVRLERRTHHWPGIAGSRFDRRH